MVRIVANESSYDTRAVRRVLQAVARAFQRREAPIRFWSTLRVRLLTGRTRIRCEIGQDGVAGGPTNMRLDLYLPALSGTEFIGLLRQQHGGDLTADHGGVRVMELALRVQSTLYEMLKGRSAAWQSRVLLDERPLRRLPPYIPLRAIKPAPPRDKLRERLERTRELEKSWQRKAKLAATKIKKLRQRRARYEKQLAQREAV